MTSPEQQARLDYLAARTHVAPNHISRVLRMLYSAAIRDHHQNPPPDYRSTPTQITGVARRTGWSRPVIARLAKLDYEYRASNAAPSPYYRGTTYQKHRHEF